MPFWRPKSDNAFAESPGSPPDHSYARRTGLVLAIVGLALTIGATMWNVDRGEKVAAENLATKGELLTFQVRELLSDSGIQIIAGGSLFRASENVRPDEFRVFVADMGLMPGILGLGYVPVVPDDELADWIAETRLQVPGLDVFEWDDDDQVVPLRPRETRFPLLYFEPFEMFSVIAGLDLGYHEDWYNDLVAGSRSDGLTMTRFIEIGLPAPLDDVDQFIIGWSIADLDTGDIDALMVAVLDLELMIGANVSQEITDGIVWEVVDVTEDPDLAPSGDNPAKRWVDEVEFGRRVWSVSVVSSVPKSGWLPTDVLYPLLGGLAITMLLASTGQLAVARSGGKRRVESLESLNDAKDEFLAAVSHRLRTPLTSVVGFSEILKDNDSGLTEMDRRELLSTIAVQAIELGHLFDNLLTVTRDANSAMFRASRVGMAGEVNHVLDTLEPARRANVKVVAADPDVVAAGDPGLVRQILRNLVANATDFGTRVELSVVDENHVAKVIVRDNGRGVSPERAKSIFDLYTETKVDRGQPKSMGVGLFVSRRLARRMSGDITYLRADDWTVFELTLPALPAPVAVKPSLLNATVN